MQLIYTSKTRRCLPRCEFPASFSASFTKSHRSNAERSIDFFEEIVCPYFKKVKKEKGVPEEQHSRVIMNTFEG